MSFQVPQCGGVFRYVVLLLVAVVVVPAGADTIEVNLVNAGSFAINADGQGTHLFTTEQQPTGTGVIKPFLTIQRKGTEHGYNTDGAMEFDQKRQANWTRSLLIQEVDPISLTVNGVTSQYMKFLLDINEEGGSKSLLSLNVLQLFVTNDPNLTGYTGWTAYGSTDFTTGQVGDGFGANATKIYDLDALNDYTVKLNYDLGSGSGSGDLNVYIPYSLIASRPEAHLVMYTAFGVPDTSGAGFEEWSVAAREVPTTAVPLPPVALVGGVLFGFAGSTNFIRRRFFAAAA